MIRGLCDLSLYLFFVCTSTLHLSSKADLVPGTLVAVNFPETIWYYRAVVMPTSSLINCKVLLLDVGIPVHVRASCLFPLLREFTLDPPLAITCRLNGIPTEPVDDVQKKLKRFFAEAKKKKTKLEAVICDVLKRRPRHPNIRQCVLLEVMILVDGADLAVRLESYTPGPFMVIPLDSVMPLEEAEQRSDHQVINFNGPDADQWHFHRIEKYSF